MIKLDDVYADFQYIFHRVKQVSFSFPPEGMDMLNSTSEYDYDYHISETNKDIHEGLVTFTIRMTNNDHEILLFTIEGFFIGNADILDENLFAEYLQVNGITTLSQLSRSILISMTSNFGMTMPVILPMINVHQLLKSKNSSLKQASNDKK